MQPSNGIRSNALGTPLLQAYSSAASHDVFTCEIPARKEEVGKCVCTA